MNQEKIEKWEKDMESRLAVYLGAMNMRGVMAGKTTDGTIEVRDMAIADIMKIIKFRLLTEKENLLKELGEKMPKEIEDIKSGENYGNITPIQAWNRGFNAALSQVQELIKSLREIKN